MKKFEKDESLRWIIQAKDEFLDADDLRNRRRYYLALFHFQQSAEKALKAFLYLKLKSFEVFYTHSVNDLIEMCIEIDPDFNKIKQAKKLDKYYIPTRYPNGLPGGIPSRYFDDPTEAEEAMKLSKEVIELIEKKMTDNP